MTVPGDEIPDAEPLSPEDQQANDKLIKDLEDLNH